MVPTFDAANLDRAGIREAFLTEGTLLVRGLLDDEFLSGLRGALLEGMRARLVSLGREVPAGDDLDEAFRMLCSDDSRRAMEIIRLGKDLPEFFRAFTDPAVLDVARACLGTQVLQCVHDISQIRIDPPGDHERDFDWHQDYQYNVASQNSVTAWCPLTDVSEDMGWLRVIPGTHSKIARVTYDTSRKVAGRGMTHSVFSLQIDPAGLEEKATALGPVRAGDVAFFHCLLLHRSGLNKGQRARWVVNPRYGEALDPSVVDRGWRTMRDKAQEVFLEVHPELVDRVE